MKISNIVYSLRVLALSSLAASMLLSCSKEDDDPWWDKPGEEKPDPKPNPDPDPNPTKSINAFMWIDAGGNFEQFANSEANIRTELKKLKDAGVTEIVVDVRPTTGDVLFNSSVCEGVKRMDVWRGSQYVWVERTASFDYLQTFITEGHALGLKVNASMNTFVGGYLCPYGLGSDGMLFRDSSKKAWATSISTSQGIVNTMDLLDSETDYGAKFLNPANDEVQKFVLQIIADLAKYDLDGIILDRCRYSDYNLMSDFSDDSRKKFEQFIGSTVSNYPGDILPAETDVTLPASQPRYCKQWLEFRAKTIHDFIVKAAEKVHSVNSKIRFGAYVGGWYSSYYASGVNWASPKYNTMSDFPTWANANYHNWGYADHCDFMFIGAYASASAIYGSGEWTVQGFCKNAKKYLAGDTKFYGGPDIGNSDGWTDGGQQSKIPQVIDVCCQETDGFFIFDLCHVRMFNYWSSLKSGITQYLQKTN